jgi:chorismate mutase
MTMTAKGKPSNRKPSAAGDGHLAEWRCHIDQLDEKLVHLLAERMYIVESVHAYKRRHQLPLYSPGREQQVLAHVKQTANAHGLDTDLAESVFLVIARWLASPDG